MPRSVLQKYREGILVGSGCNKGEVFEGMMQKSPDEVEEIAQFYDYLKFIRKQVYASIIRNGISSR